ncbi:MAG: choice-of-anchor D domain-containing protein [Deltaproteobacteria bacterium]|nr:choice-of-anchor D domain-containing protein [Deltaproteobacteria bacterium]TLN00998.1 MAG: choice-of-anchor D domain-containing protein [bacterium]
MKRSLLTLCLSVILSLMAIGSSGTASAQQPAQKIPVSQGQLKQINKYFSTQDTTYNDGSVHERAIIHGPPKPPPGYLTRATALLPAPMPELGANSLADVPTFTWVFGCSAVSGSMIAGYYDRNGFPNIYTGATNGGVIPLVEDSAWGRWTDNTGDNYPNNPLIASHQGLDGRTDYGSIDDYWVSYLSNSRDPYSTGHWTQHPWGDAVGDYMKTSQYAYNNVDGSTSFYYINSATPLSCAAMEVYGEAPYDGTYGRKLFYEARGYTVTDCYTQMTDNKHAGGFSFAQFKTEIDAGRPVLLNLDGHSVVGVGYDDSSNTVYLHDTWDNKDHTMTWGGSYSGMGLWGVSIVNLAATSGDPDISVSPGSYDFGNVGVQSTATKTFTIANTGTGSLIVGTITITGSDFTLGTDGCSGRTVAPSSSCTVQVAFTPTAVGSRSATLSIPSNDPDENPVTVALAGTGADLRPDLYGVWSNITKSGPKKGVFTVTGSFTTTNGGPASASNVVVNFYRSDDGTYNTGDTLVGTYKSKILATGASKTTTIRFTSTTDPAGKFVIAVIDPLNKITESDENNNSASASIP